MPEGGENPFLDFIRQGPDNTFDPAAAAKLAAGSSTTTTTTTTTSVPAAATAVTDEAVPDHILLDEVLPVGTTVTVFGLKAKAELNGRVGTVVLHPSPSERVRVMLQCGRELLVAPKNAREATPEEEATEAQRSDARSNAGAAKQPAARPPPPTAAAASADASSKGSSAPIVKAKRRQDEPHPGREIAVRAHAADVPLVLFINRDAMQRPLMDAVIEPFVRAYNCNPEVRTKLHTAYLMKAFLGEVETTLYDMPTQRAFQTAGILRRKERIEVLLQFRPALPSVEGVQKPSMLHADLKGRYPGIKPDDFETLLLRVRESESHDEYRVKVLQNALVNRTVTCEQARRLIKEIAFEQNQASIATAMWRSVSDRENFDRVVLSSMSEQSRHAVLRVLSTSGFGGTSAESRQHYG
jgi:hypothetical protein